MFINLLECLERIEELDSLIQLEKTGRPNELAENLDLSVRQIYRLIGFMKNRGAEIEFCNYKQSYTYVNPVKFQMGFVKQEMAQVH